MPSPASLAAPSPAWPRFSICERVGGFYTFVWIDCATYYFGILSLSKNVCYTFALSRNGILLWLAPYWNVMLFCFCLFLFRGDRKCLPSALLSFFHKIWPISPSLTHTGLQSFPWQISLKQCHHQHPQRRLHRPDRARSSVREGGCYTFVWIDCVIYYFIIPSLSKSVCFRFALSCNGIL